VVVEVYNGHLLITVNLLLMVVLVVVEDKEQDHHVFRL
tara:strand:+ start:94 stop:207 length:114 start_codon:yes stop_codon:yes gene_type:complete